MIVLVFANYMGFKCQNYRLRFKKFSFQIYNLYVSREL